MGIGLFILKNFSTPLSISQIENSRREWESKGKYVFIFWRGLSYVIKDDNKKKLVSLEKELFKYFNKDKVGYYRKTDSLVLNCLRGMCKELEVNFIMVKKGKYDTFNNKVYKRSGYYYTIK